MAPQPIRCNMKIKFMTTLAGVNYVYHSGDVVDAKQLIENGVFSKEEVKRFLESGVCVQVAKKIEKAAK